MRMLTHVLLSYFLRYHIFDGDGMVHGVTFDGGRATYVLDPS